MTRSEFLGLPLLLAAPDARAEEVKADAKALAAADPRLAKTVTLAYPRVLLGELVEDLTRQCGVPVACAPDRITSGIPVFAFATRASLADTLVGLVSLLSFRGAPLLLERIDERYQLRLPPSSRAFFQRFEDAVRDDAIRSLETLIGALDASPEQRASLAQRLPDMRYLDDSRMRSGLEGLAALTDSKQRARLYTEGGRVSGPLGGAPGSLRDNARQEIEMTRRRRPDYDQAGVTHFHFEVLDEHGIPTLIVRYGDQSTGEGHGIAGGIRLDERWRESLTASWILDADTVVDAKSDAPIGPWAPGKPATGPDETFASLEALSRTVGAPVFGRLGDDPRYLALRAVPTVGRVASALRSSLLMVKKRGDTWLVLDRALVRTRYEDYVPWETVRAVREDMARADRDGRCLALLHGLCKSLRPAQIHRLDQETGREIADLLDRIAPLLAPLRTGSPLVAALEDGRRLVCRDLPPGTQAALRTIAGRADLTGLTLRYATAPAEDGRSLRFRVEDRVGKSVGVETLYWSSRSTSRAGATVR